MVWGYGMVEGPPPWRSVLYRGAVLIVFFIVLISIIIIIMITV